MGWCVGDWSLGWWTDTTRLVRLLLTHPNTPKPTTNNQQTKPPKQGEGRAGQRAGAAGRQAARQPRGQLPGAGADAALLQVRIACADAGCLRVYGPWDAGTRMA